MNDTLRKIRIGAVVPLTMGSVFFFYWYYMRTLFAENIRLEVLAFLAILVYGIVGLFVSINVVVFLVRHSKEWRNVIAPVLILLVTVPVIDFYSTVYRMLSEKAFVCIINDSGNHVDKIWSKNIETVPFERSEKQFVISYDPVYYYDWTKFESSVSSMFFYEIEPVYIRMIDSDGSTSKYVLPSYHKGACSTIKISELKLAQ